jgi:ketosteroid isomerase-like protein
MAAQLSTNAEIVGAYLDAVSKKDHSIVERFLAPDIEYIVNGTSHRDREGKLPPISPELEAALPWLGKHDGHANVSAFLDRLHANLDVTAYGPREVISEGDRAAAFGWFRLAAKATGRVMDIPYAIYFEMENGKIRKYHFLESTFDVAAAFRDGGKWIVKRDQVDHEIPEPSIAS